MSEKAPTLGEQITRVRLGLNRTAWKLGAVGLALLTPFAAYDYGHTRGSEPAIVTDCEDAPVAAEGGDFTQAIRDAAREADANPGIDYLGLGGELSDAVTTPENPEGHAHPGQSVWAAVDADGNLKTYGHGTCEQPWPQAKTATPQN